MVQQNCQDAFHSNPVMSKSHYMTLSLNLDELHSLGNMQSQSDDLCLNYQPLLSVNQIITHGPKHPESPTDFGLKSETGFNMTHFTKPVLNECFSALKTLENCWK